LTDDPARRRVLVVVAHPDDVDFGAAGTIATLTELGRSRGVLPGDLR
jgi:LmbE family N-acetylglucosaminyl deacetylase